MALESCLQGQSTRQHLPCMISDLEYVVRESMSFTCILVLCHIVHSGWQNDSIEVTKYKETLQSTNTEDQKKKEIQPTIVSTEDPKD